MLGASFSAQSRQYYRIYLNCILYYCTVLSELNTEKIIEMFVQENLFKDFKEILY